GEAAGEGDEAARVLVEERPVDARLVVVALEVAEAREPDQVGVALVRLGEEGQVGVALLLRLPVVGDAALAASAGIRQAPSRIEYSLWTWRWTNGGALFGLDSGTGKPSY